MLMLNKRKYIEIINDIINDTKNDIINDTKNDIINDTKNDIINDTKNDIINDTKKIKLDFDKFISPTNLKNYILHDTIIDYLEYYKINNINDKPNHYRTLITINSEFDDFIKLAGIEFEKKIIDKFKHKLYKIESAISIVSYNETITALLNNEPIIYQGVLIDFKNNIYGRPDLIIKGKYLKLLYNNIIVETENINDDIYYIIDIKYSTIQLSSNKTNIYNINYQQVYKSQILVYTNLLNKILNQNVKIGFILGKRYLVIKNKIKQIINNNEYDKIVSINYKNKDSNYYQLNTNAIKWIVKLRNEGKNWCLLPKPTVPELYPTMTNTKDGKWRPLKKILADEIKELTLLLNVGHVERLNAFNKNIFSYEDINCTAEILGLKGKRGDIVNKIINISKPSCTDIFRPNIIKTNINNWRQTNNKLMEFYLDYETTTDFEDSNFIFMIGVGYNNSLNEWTFQSFISKDKNINSQQEMFNNFWNYIDDLLIKNNKKNGVYFHWSNAEPAFYNKSKNKLMIKDKIFLDLHKVFITEPIVIKNNFNYSLKSVSKTLYANNLIKTSWSLNSNCNNGLDALIQANKLYFNNVNLNENNMNEILKYNEIDCKVLFEIHEYLRTYH